MNIQRGDVAEQLCGRDLYRGERDQRRDINHLALKTTRGDAAVDWRHHSLLRGTVVN